MYLLSHEVAVPDRRDLLQRGEAGAVHHHGADIHDAVEPPRRAPDLESAEARRCVVGVGGEHIADEEAYGADEVVAEGADSVDGDADTGGVAGEKIRRNSEEELIVPGRVVAAELVDACSELGGGVDPRDGVGLKPPPWR